MSKKLEYKTITTNVISYCDIPKKIARTNETLKETGCDVLVPYSVTSKRDQKKFDDDFALDNWIIKTWPELEGRDILIHIDI